MIKTKHFSGMSFWNLSKKYFISLLFIVIGGDSNSKRQNVCSNISIVRLLKVDLHSVAFAKPAHDAVL
jgi:hypothetical protein